MFEDLCWLKMFVRFQHVREAFMQSHLHRSSKNHLYRSSKKLAKSLQLVFLKYHVEIESSYVGICRQKTSHRSDLISRPLWLLWYNTSPLMPVYIVRIGFIKSTPYVPWEKKSSQRRLLIKTFFVFVYLQNSVVQTQNLGCICVSSTWIWWESCKIINIIHTKCHGNKWYLRDMTIWG